MNVYLVAHRTPGGVAKTNRFYRSVNAWYIFYNVLTCVYRSFCKSGRGSRIEKTPNMGRCEKNRRIRAERERARVLYVCVSSFVSTILL